MQEECLICKAPLKYLQQEEWMECFSCGKREKSRTRCVNGHYICNECHTEGVDEILKVCMGSDSTSPIVILEEMMGLSMCHMHGPEHHVMVGAALITAYYNAGGSVSLEYALKEMLSRGKEVPGGACGFWGACGAGISTGICFSILTETTPLSGESWGLANGMTAEALRVIGSVGGPRCCKRDSYLAILSGVDYIREHLGVVMEKTMPVCTHFFENNQCLGRKCPFSPASTTR